MQRSRIGRSQKEKMIEVFRTCKVVEGRIINWENQLKQLESDFGEPITLPEFSIPSTGTYRLRITAGAKIQIDIEPYTPRSHLHLTLYPEPVDGDKIKTIAYRNRGFIRDYARSKGFDDALVMCKEGYLTEASNSNFFFEHEGKYYTPDPSLPYLMGLTIRSLDFEFEYIKIKPQELPLEAKIYLCNSMMGVIETTYSLD